MFGLWFQDSLSLESFGWGGQYSVRPKVYASDFRKSSEARLRRTGLLREVPPGSADSVGVDHHAVRQADCIVAIGRDPPTRTTVDRADPPPHRFRLDGVPQAIRQPVGLASHIEHGSPPCPKHGFAQPA